MAVNKHIYIILGRNLDKSLKSFSSLLFTVTSTALLKISISSYSRNLLQFLKRRKEENMIENQTPYVLRNPYRNLEYENSQDYA